MWQRNGQIDLRLIKHIKQCPIHTLEMTVVYVLRLKHKKWYVGKSDNWDSRFDAHVTGRGPLWTKTHRPVEVFELSEMTSKYDEQNKTIEYMGKYGVDNVRGGPFSGMVVDAHQRRVIDQLYCDAEDLCFSCKQPGHMTNSCRGLRTIVVTPRSQSAPISGKRKRSADDVGDCDQPSKKHRVSHEIRAPAPPTETPLSTETSNP